MFPSLTWEVKKSDFYPQNFYGQLCNREHVTAVFSWLSCCFFQCNGKNVLMLPCIVSVLLVPSLTSFRRCGGNTATHHHLPSLKSVIIHLGCHYTPQKGGQSAVNCSNANRFLGCLSSATSTAFHASQCLNIFTTNMEFVYKSYLDLVSNGKKK